MGGLEFDLSFSSVTMQFLRDLRLHFLVKRRRRNRLVFSLSKVEPIKFSCILHPSSYFYGTKALSERNS